MTTRMTSYGRPMPTSRPVSQRSDPVYTSRMYSYGAGGDPETLARNRAVQESMRKHGQIHGLGGLGVNIAAGQAAIDAAKRALAAGGLHGFACNNCERLLREAKRVGGLGNLGLNYSGAASGASTGATVGSAVPVIGTAVGAVVGAVAGALFSKKKDPNAAEKNALKGQLDEYMHIQGTVPGRAFTLKTLEQLVDGAGLRGMWPNVKKWSGNAIGQVTADQGPNGIRAFVKNAVASGKIDPTALANDWTDLVNRTWGSKWFVASAGATQRQLITDMLDYFIAETKPDAPLFYAPGWTVAASQTPVSSSPASSIVPISTPSTTPASTPLPVQPPTSSAVPNAVVTPTTTAPQIDVAALVNSLMQQGATQQQAYLAALQNLQSQGVTATPQVQQAVADQVNTASAAGGGLFGNVSPWLIAAGVGLTAISFWSANKSGKTSH